jgi:hypothetical protein
MANLLSPCQVSGERSDISSRSVLGKRGGAWIVTQAWRAGDLNQHLDEVTHKA